LSDSIFSLEWQRQSEIPMFVADIIVRIARAEMYIGGTVFGLPPRASRFRGLVSAWSPVSSESLWLMIPLFIGG
jgi:hypothetical protein